MHGRAARFLVVGVGCALLYFSLAWVLQERSGLPPFLAIATAYLISFGIAYILQRAWTFQSDLAHTVSLPRYAAVQALAAFLTAASTQSIVHFYPSSSSMMIAAASTVLAGSLSFLLTSTWVFSHASTRPNSQYNVAKPDSLPVKLAAYQRRRMYERFLKDVAIRSDDSLLDVGVTSDRSYEASNYVEAWYPHKARVTALGIDDASFLEQQYPGMKFVQANGLDMPFEDLTFDVVHSSAVIEHVGSYENQLKFARECARVARKAVFLTTPNRWFPVEFHTVLPLLHWLPKRWFRAALRAVGMGFFASEENLNLLSSGQCKRIAAALPGFDVTVSSVALGCWPSNLLIIARRLDNSQS